MSVELIAVPHPRPGARVVATLLVVTFAGGMLTGFSLPRAASGASHVDAAAGSSVHSSTWAGVADNNMSDAARAAFATTQAAAVERAWAGVADNNMSDAARAAFAITQAAAVERAWAGVADNNMSDAARAAWAMMYGR